MRYRVFIKIKKEVNRIYEFWTFYIKKKKIVKFWKANHGQKENNNFIIWQDAVCISLNVCLLTLELDFFLNWNFEPKPDHKLEKNIISDGMKPVIFKEIKTGTKTINILT